MKFGGGGGERGGQNPGIICDRGLLNTPKVKQHGTHKVVVIELVWLDLAKEKLHFFTK